MIFLVFMGIRRDLFSECRDGAQGTGENTRVYNNYKKGFWSVFDIDYPIQCWGCDTVDTDGFSRLKIWVIVWGISYICVSLFVVKNRVNKGCIAMILYVTKTVRIISNYWIVIKLKITLNFIQENFSLLLQNTTHHIYLN